VGTLAWPNRSRTWAVPTETVTAHPQRRLSLWMTLRHIFAYTQPMSFGFPILERKQFVVTCKRCRRDVPAVVREFPFQPIVVTCPLCGELRRYLPSEVFLGQPNSLVSKQARRREG
jgi:hypothetical protein